MKCERGSLPNVTDVTVGGAMRSHVMDRDSELALVCRIRAGDTAAFDSVYDQFNGRLFGFLVRLARSRDVAEDLLEETWLRFVANAARLDEETRLGPWLFTVARNLHVSYCRSRAFEEPNGGELLSLWPARFQQSPFEQAAFGELERRIESALAALPVAFREVLLLVGVEGLRPHEAAVVCGITPEALRQRLKRARDLLAARLESKEVRR
ncbi:MAG TPA: RNA polymerase sigma factor [Vicinamibacterales bacterium]|nr:RNA polymerase sigma factor [Vicinamibacterales bacterium]